MGFFGAVGKAIKKSASVVNRAVTKPGSNPFKSDAKKKEPIASLRTAGAASAPTPPSAKVERPSVGKQMGGSLDLGKKRKSFGAS